MFFFIYGLEKRFIAHTCTVTIDIPAMYNEFVSELKLQLESNSWEFILPRDGHLYENHVVTVLFITYSLLNVLVSY